MIHLFTCLFSLHYAPKGLHSISLYLYNDNKEIFFYSILLNKYVAGFWCDVRDNRRWTFSPEEVLLWIMDSFFGQKQFEVKNVLMDLSQLLSSPDVNWWTGVVWIICGLLWCFYQLFGLSFWRHPFTAEHPLLSKWWNDTFLQIWWRNKLILILNDLRVRTYSATKKMYKRKKIGVTYSFN